MGGVVEAVSHLGFTARASRQVAGREHFPARIPGQAPEKGHDEEYSPAHVPGQTPGKGRIGYLAFLRWKRGRMDGSTVYFPAR